MFACAVKHPDVEISHRYSNWEKRLVCSLLSSLFILVCERVRSSELRETNECEREFEAITKDRDRLNHNKVVSEPRSLGE